MNNIDLAIIGAGIAGVSCAMYAKRAGLDFFIFDSMAIGGQLLFMENVDNYPGVKIGVKGKELADVLSESLKELNIDVKQDRIIKVEEDKKEVKLYSQDSLYSAKGLVIATGAAFKKLNVQGEEKFLGRGVSYCAVCDGFFFRNKVVGVVGGGNIAVEEALYLSNICRKVYLIHRRDKLRALEYLQKELFNRDNIEIIFDSVVSEVKGEESLKEIIIENVKSKRINTLKLQGLFIAVGVNPATELVKGIVKTDDGGFIVTDEEMKSSCDFIWAAGDCRKKPLRQLITAASEGALAAITVYKYLKGHYISS